MGNENINMAEWYTAQEAAEKLGTSVKYVRTLAVQYGNFRTHKLNRMFTLYWKEDVDAYHVEKNKPGPRKKKPKDEEAFWPMAYAV